MGNQQITPKDLGKSQFETPRKPQPGQIPSQTAKQRPVKLQPLKHNQSAFSSPKLKRPATSSSLSQFRVTSTSGLKLKRKNSNDIIQVMQSLQQDDGLSLDELDNIYFISGANYNDFYNNLQEPLSKLYTESSKYALTLMTNKMNLSKRQAILYLCEKLLKVNLNIMKILGQKSNHEFNEEVFKKFNELQRSIIGYLKTKYPSGNQNFVSGDLMKVFKSFDYVESPQNDIVRQAGFYFRQQLTRDLLKKIKQFLNKVIDQTDINFPRFQKMFQDQIFKSNLKEEKSLVYRLDRRLPETISKFTSINSNSLEIDSPQLFKVVLKWVNDMEDFLINTNQEVDEKQTFKMINQEDQFKYYVDQITTEENFTIKQQLKDALQLQIKSYQDQLNNLINSMYRFQHNLVKIIEQGELSQRYVPRNDAETIKFAAYNTKFMSWMLTQKLTIVMKKLIKIGRSFKNTLLMAPIDLIKFNVTDMLSASMHGKKNQILQVYSNLKKLQTQQKIKIIRQQNRLSTATNDIKINFKLKNSFLICELLLVLSETTHSPNQKVKCKEMFNQFFNQLQSSPYGVASQLAEYVGYKDSKVAFEKKINFVSKEFGIAICELRHPTKISIVKEQLEPFVCTTCSKFYGRLENLFVMKNCKQCNNFLCFKCMFAKNSTLEATYLKSQIIEYLNNQMITDGQNNRGKGQGAPISGSLLYQKSFEKFNYIKDITKERKLKKMTITQFEAYISELDLKHFVYGVYEKGEISLISCKYNYQLKELSFGMDSDQDFYKSKRITFKENDFILFFKHITIITVESSALEKTQFINVFSSDSKLKKGKYQAYKINETTILIGYLSEQTPQKIIDGQEGKQNNFYSSAKKDFKFDSLKTYFQYQGQGDIVTKNLKLQDLGIEKRHLSYFNSLSAANQILEINLSKNKISDINDLLNALPNIKRLIATQNYIKSFIPPISLNNLTTIVLKRNIIKQINKMDNIPNVEKLNLQQNRILTFPTLSFKRLRHLNLACNVFLTNMDFLQRSILPQLTYANLEGSMDNIQYANIDQETRSILIPFKKLKCLIINSLKVSKITFATEDLERLQLPNSSVVQIEGNFTRLEYFIANSCNFTNFDLLFGDNGQNHVIKEICFQYGYVDKLPKVMKSKSLRKIDIHNCKITDATPLGKSNLPSLQYLDISCNQITKIPKLSFQKLSNFIFQGNTLEQIEDFAQSYLPEVTTLQFYGQRPIKAWPKFDFPNLTDFYLPALEYPEGSFQEFQKSKLPKLTNFVVQYCKLENFPVINFPRLQKLQILYSTVRKLDVLARCNFQSLQTIQLNSINQQYQNISPQDLLKNKIDLPLNLNKLEEITMTSCRFSNLSQLFSKPYSNLIRISAQYSELESIPKLQLPKLKGIFLYSNQISDIDMFCESYLPSLQELDLSSNKITSIKKMNFKALQILNLSSNEITSINGLDLPSLFRIDFSLNKLDQFPEIWGEKLTDINFSSNPLKSLIHMQKCFLPSLKNLSFNSIELQEQHTILPKFQMPNIESINFSMINFSSINSINTLKKLNYLEISLCNNIKQFPKLELDQLKNLTLSQSTFESWQGFWQSKIQNLQSLYIYATNIKKIGQVRFPHLTQLNISNNHKLVQIQALLTCNKFTELNSMTITSNMSLKIENELNLPHVSYLNISNASITSSRLIGQSDKMQSITLRESSFSELNLREFRKLNHFEASICDIQDIQKFCSMEWRVLTHLVLSDNRIKTLYPMTKFPTLSSLYLNNNSIVDPKQLLENSNLPNLDTLNLQRNQIVTINAVKNLPALSLLLLDFNQIQDISFLNRFENVNPFFNTIFLNFNKIIKVPPIKSSLEVIQLSQNQIESMDFIDKSDMPRLANLSLSRNKIKKIISVSKFNKLNTLVIDSNPIEDYDDFFMKSKMPLSLTYLVASLNVLPEKVDADRAKYIEKHPTMSIDLYAYFPPQQQFQQNIQLQSPQFQQ